MTFSPFPLIITNSKVRLFKCYERLFLPLYAYFLLISAFQLVQRDITNLNFVGSNNFSTQFIKIISHYKKIGYNINVLQQTACLVVNPITVGNFAFLFNCTPVAVSPNHVVCDVNFWYHRQLNHQQEASPRNFNQS